MAQGVRNAKEFQEKFQQMMRTVKEVATAMSTSLEQAQEVMASMRGAGVFGGGRQTAMARMIRAGAVEGGLATSELAQMANVGSQISRAIGGRGQAGAVAGVRAVTNIGAAVQAGVLSEEDIYNATGQTGAAGRQALATNLLQGEARFFKRGLGRRVLAAMAERGGRLDEEMVQRFMGGEVGTGETMREAYGHLARVGRANFIRNEGRLRGEAVAAFGGMGRAVVAQGWLRSRGMNVYDMSDRQMLFFQRKFGFDRDEADAVVKMARDIDRIQETRSDRRDEDEVVRGVERYRRTIGIEGIKRKFESARQEVNNSLKQAGSDLFEWGREHIERTLNKMTGDYVRTVDRDLGGAIRDVMRGREDTAREVFGLGMGGAGRMPLATDMEVNEVFGGAANVGGADWLRQNRKAFGRAGYRFDESGDIGQQLSTFRKLRSAVAAGTHEDVTEMFAAMDLKDMGGSSVEKFKQRMASAISGMEGSGTDRLDKFEQVLRRSGPEGQRLAERYARADIVEKGRIYGAVATSAGVKDPGREFELPDELGLLGEKKFATVGERRETVSDYLFGKRPTAVTRKGWVASLLAAVATAPTGGPGTVGPVGAEQVERQEQMKQAFMGGTEEEARLGKTLTAASKKAAVAYLEDPQTAALSRKALMGDKEERDTAVEQMQGRYLELQRQVKAKADKDEEISDELAGQLAGSKAQVAAGRLARGDSKEDIAKDLDMTVSEVERSGKTVRALEVTAQKRKQRAYFRRAGAMYREERAALGIEVGKGGQQQQDLEDIAAQRARLQKAGLKGEDLDRAMRFVGKYRAGVAAGAEMTGVSDQDRQRHETAQTRFDEAMGELTDMDSASIKRGLAAGVFAAQGGAGAARRVLGRREALAAAKKSRRKGAGLQTIAGMLGGELDEETAKQIYAIDDTQKQAAALEKALGITGKAGAGEMQQLLEAMKKGDIKAAEKEFRDLDTESVRKGLDEKRIKRDDEAARLNDPTVRAIDSMKTVLEGGLKVRMMNAAEIAEHMKKGEGDQPGTGP
jgi:hypothetical protein